METLSKFYLPGGMFLLTLAAGVWLSRVGKPYNAALFNLHKLIALAALVLTVLQAVRLAKAAPALVIALLAVAALCALGLFISGALMSAGKLDDAVLHGVHRLLPAALAVALGVAVYLLAFAARAG
ncbi:MAG: hypothetical protein HPY45_14715 [Anaerolineae bacterium]|nr:hypothetical protein [Anaerolineae bacterium]